MWRETRQDPVDVAPLRRRRRVTDAAVLGEDDAQVRPPDPREHAVDERRIVMAVDDIRPYASRDGRDPPAERWGESRPPPERHDFDAFAPQVLGPGARFVEAAHRHP